MAIGGHNLSTYGIQISLAKPGKPKENAYAERWMSAIKEEKVEVSEYLDFEDARHQIGCFIENVYMTKRIHSALGYLTPTEFESALRLAPAEQITP